MRSPYCKQRQPRLHFLSSSSGSAGCGRGSSGRLPGSFIHTNGRHHALRDVKNSSLLRIPRDSAKGEEPSRLESNVRERATKALTVALLWFTERGEPPTAKCVSRYVLVADFNSNVAAQFPVPCAPTYQHWRWNAAGQWSQHSRSPPSRQLSQVSWLVARPLLRTSLTNFRLRFSTSSDFGGASSVWICWTTK